jgi:hypothetical protein
LFLIYCLIKFAIRVVCESFNLNVFIFFIWQMHQHYVILVIQTKVFDQKYNFMIFNRA